MFEKSIILGRKQEKVLLFTVFQCKCKSCGGVRSAGLPSKQVKRKSFSMFFGRMKDLVNPNSKSSSLRC